MDGMKFFTVLYRNGHMGFMGEPLGFQCWGDDADHAEEQCEDAEKDDPGLNIIWVYETEGEHSVADAVKDWLSEEHYPSNS